MMGVQHCKCTQCHWIVYLNMVKKVNFVLHIFYYNLKERSAGWEEKVKLSSDYYFTIVPGEKQQGNWTFPWRGGSHYRCSFISDLAPLLSRLLCVWNTLFLQSPTVQITIQFWETSLPIYSHWCCPKIYSPPCVSQLCCITIKIISVVTTTNVIFLLVFASEQGFDWPSMILMVIQSRYRTFLSLKDPSWCSVIATPLP